MTKRSSNPVTPYQPPEGRMTPDERCAKGRHLRRTTAGEALVNTDARATELAVLLGRLAELMSDGQRSALPQPPPRPMPERVLLTVEEAAEQLGIGRTLTYKLINSGEIESIRIGRLRRVPTTAIQDYARRLSGDGPSGHVA
jgi:excisionase family DNA binding protein